MSRRRSGPQERANAPTPTRSDFLWHPRAACRGEDRELFFPRPGEVALKARSICGRCPVQTECLTYGLKYERFGIYGGLTPLERRALRREAAA